MVPADSRRIPRDPRYSGYRWDHTNFEYRAVTFYGGAFQLTSSHFYFSVARSYYPVGAVTPAVWAVPRSLATTGGITLVFFSCRYEDVSGPCVGLRYSVCHVFNMSGCPIRKSRGQGSFAPNPGLSQLVTSFFASESQGIHRLHLTFSLMPFILKEYTCYSLLLIV